MKLSTIATTIAAVTAGSLLLASTAQAGTVVQTYGDSYSNSKSVTDTNNVTVLKIRERGYSTDATTGGLSDPNRCQGLPCSPTDNDSSFVEVSYKKTDLVIATTGQNITNTAVQSCFSGGDVNGLSYKEGRSSTVASNSGYSNTDVSGTVVDITKTWSKSTNGAAENGYAYKFEKSTTSVNESTDTIFSGGSTTITFTSSIGL